MGGSVVFTCVLFCVVSVTASSDRYGTYPGCDLDQYYPSWSESWDDPHLSVDDPSIIYFDNLHSHYHQHEKPPGLGPYHTHNPSHLLDLTKQVDKLTRDWIHFLDEKIDRYSKQNPVEFLSGTDVGSHCKLPNGQISKCEILTDCPSAYKDFRRGIPPIRCGFKGFAEVVCCPDAAKPSWNGNGWPQPTNPSVWFPGGNKRKPSPRPTFLTPTRPTPVTPPKVTPPKVSPTISTGTPTPKPEKGLPIRGNVGVRSAAACQRYMDTFTPGITSFIKGGEEAKLTEFPHMALIGYPYNGEESSRSQISDGRNISWRCGGTLLSEKFVLTAAHCVVGLDENAPQLIRVGDLDFQNDTDGAKPQDVMIKKIILQPEYRSQWAYHDIALLELERPVVFTAAVQPACLPRPDDQDLTGRTLQLTGWGDLEFAQDKRSSTLMKTSVQSVPLDICNQTYSGEADRGRLPKALIDRGHLCAQDKIGLSDGCPGDSGGPLQESITGNGAPLFRVVGVVSFGKGCSGTVPSLYAKVADYVDWIEGVVWPNK